ncbi:MAG: transcription termination factor NusA [Candidatus Omnitrophica bacterium]|nr:transcription termination factor NusA [Candidatus Omnitrophota bacterium]
MNNELLNIIDTLEREKGVEKEVLFQAIEAALISAAKKVLGQDKEDITSTMDRETGEIKIFCQGKEVNSSNFGRISAQTAKQVIIQKIREAERSVILNEYEGKVSTIVAGSVHRFDKGNIIVDFGKTEGVLPKMEQIQKERYKQGERVRAYILEVSDSSHGPQIILSRRAAEFVIKLFELEVPEIIEGIVEIRGISREPGERTKMAVFSKDDKIDPVGSCVGVRGARVKDIVRELRGERIDIIRWSDDFETYVKNIFSPIEIKKMNIDREKKKMEVIVDDEFLSIGIGKHGQNIRLVSKLLDWEVDIRGEKQIQDEIDGKTTDNKPAKKASKKKDNEEVAEEATEDVVAEAAEEAVGETTEEVTEDAVEEKATEDAQDENKEEKE